MKHLITLSLVLVGCSAPYFEYVEAADDGGSDAPGGAAGAAGAAGAPGGAAGALGGSGGSGGKKAVPCFTTEWEVVCPAPKPQLCAQDSTTMQVHCVECITNADCAAPKTCNQELYACQ